MLAAADYLLTLAARGDLPELPPGELHDGRTPVHVGRVFAARTHLADELRRLWKDIRSQLAA